MNAAKLKEKIFEITKPLQMDERQSQELAFKLFIDYAYSSALAAWAGLHQQMGVYLCYNYPCILPEKADEIALDEALKIYCSMVSSNKPFSDVLSNLSEEINLSGRKGKNRGKGKGQFYTPQPISDVLTNLTLPDDSEISSWETRKLVGDITCGAGTLILSFLANVYRVDKEKLYLVDLILNDVDELACKSTILQILSPLTIFNLKLHGMKVFKADAIKQYNEDGHLYFSYKAR